MRSGGARDEARRIAANLAKLPPCPMCVPLAHCDGGCAPLRMRRCKKKLANSTSLENSLRVNEARTFSAKTQRRGRNSICVSIKRACCWRATPKVSEHELRCYTWHTC